ncbi:MAG: hypothetical protein ABSF65_04380 [Candidatus Bathyarchaeia archaeon]
MNHTLQTNMHADPNHKHEIKKTHVTFVEYDDVNFNKLAKDIKYFGEGNSKERVLEFDFEYCLSCSLRLLDGKPIMTRDILENEFERLVRKAKNNKYVSSEQTTIQHSDFETLERLINSALEFGKLNETKT